jgi:hypothetical protein
MALFVSGCARNRLLRLRPMQVGRLKSDSRRPFHPNVARRNA